MTISKEVLDELLKNYQKPEDLPGESGILKQLTKALLDRCVQGEMTHHLGYARNDRQGKYSGFPVMRGRIQAVLSGAEKHCKKMDTAGAELEICPQSDGYYIRRKIAFGMTTRVKGIYTKLLTRPGTMLGSGANGYMVEILWHRREIRRQTEKTNIKLNISRNQSTQLILNIKKK